VGVPGLSGFSATSPGGCCSSPSPTKSWSLTPPLAVCPSAARNQTFSEVYQMQPQLQSTASRDQPHHDTWESYREKNSCHATFEYMPCKNHHRKQDVLRPIGSPTPTLMQFLFSFQKEKNLMGRITAASELLMITRMRSVTSPLPGALLKATGRSQLYSCNINYWPGTAISQLTGYTQNASPC